VCSAGEALDLGSLTLSELLKVKVKIATKNEEAQLYSASSVTVFTRKDIKRLGADTLTDLISQVPGFYSMMNAVEGNQSHVVMRGHAQKYANTLLILLNGQRINEDYTGGINYLMRFISLRNVSKVEVVRGPGSALYGSNAYSGVINIITDFSPRVSLGVGSFNATELSAAYQVPLSGWQLGASLDIYQDDGDEFNDVFDRNGIQDATQDPHEVMQASLRLSNEKSELNLNYLRSERDDYYLFRRLRDDVTHIELEHWALYGSHQLIDNDLWSTQVNAGYQMASRQSITALTPGGEPPFESADFLFGEDFNYASANIAIDSIYNLSPDQTVNFGFSYSESEVPEGYIKSNYDVFGDLSYLGQVTTFVGDDFRVVMDKRRSITSGYLQTQWRASSKLNVTAGLRYDAYNDVDNALTPRVSMVYSKSDNEIVKFIYGEAYRAPSLGDLYDEESGLTTGNRNLNASELRSVELVYTYFNDDFSLTSTIFDNHHENLIGFRVGDDGNVFLDNVAVNEAHGFELEWRQQFSTRVRADFALTHLFKNETDLGMAVGLPASEHIAPDTYANFGVYYTNDLWELGVAGNWRNSIDVLEDQGNLFLLNAKFSYHLTDNSDIHLRIKNLTNENYETSSYVVLGTDDLGNDVQAYPARGLQWLLSYEHQF